jgi:hypothetical protein
MRVSAEKMVVRMNALKGLPLKPAESTAYLRAWLEPPARYRVSLMPLGYTLNAMTLCN